MANRPGNAYYFRKKVPFQEVVKKILEDGQISYQNLFVDGAFQFFVQGQNTMVECEHSYSMPNELYFASVVDATIPVIFLEALLRFFPE